LDGKEFEDGLPSVPVDGASIHQGKKAFFKKLKRLLEF